MSSYPQAAFKPQRMAWNQMIEAMGLCATCDHLEGCAFRKNPDQPVLFCESFEACVSPLKETPQTQHTPRAEARSVSLYTGLCINCADAEVCVFPQKGAGGWYCEEYR